MDNVTGILDTKSNVNIPDTDAQIKSQTKNKGVNLIWK